MRIFVCQNVFSEEVGFGVEELPCRFRIIREDERLPIMVIHSDVIYKCPHCRGQLTEVKRRNI